jgi:hypothetical protein
MCVYGATHARGKCSYKVGATSEYVEVGNLSKAKRDGTVANKAMSLTAYWFLEVSCRKHETEAKQAMQRLHASTILLYVKVKKLAL